MLKTSYLLKGVCMESGYYSQMFHIFYLSPQNSEAYSKQAPTYTENLLANLGAQHS